MTPKHHKAIGLYWSQYSTSEVANLSGLKTQDRVRRVWKAAIARGEIVPIPNCDRPRDGFTLEIVMLGQIGNQCSPERRVA